MQLPSLPLIIPLHIMVHLHLVLRAFLEQPHLLDPGVFFQNTSDEIQGNDIQNAKTGYRYQPLCFTASRHHADCHDDDHTEYGEISIPGPLPPG